MVRYPFYNWQNGFARRSPDHYPTVYPYLFLHFTAHDMPQRGYMFVVKRARNFILAPSGLRYPARCPLCRMFRFSGHPVKN